MVKGKAGPRPGPKVAKAPKPAKALKRPKVGVTRPPKADNPRAAPGANKVTLSGDERRQSFLQFNSQIIRLRSACDAAEKLFDEAIAEAKAAGFSKKMFDIAKALADLKGEKKIKLEVGDRLQVAQWLGHPLGAQLDMFSQPDRTPIVDRAYDAGKADSMSGKPRKPEFAAETDAYRAYMAGFDDDQRRLQGGFTKLEPRTDEIENQVAQRAAREPVLTSADADADADGDAEFVDDDGSGGDFD